MSERLNFDVIECEHNCWVCNNPTMFAQTYRIIETNRQTQNGVFCLSCLNDLCKGLQQCITRISRGRATAPTGESFARKTESSAAKRAAKKSGNTSQVLKRVPSKK